MQVPWYGPHLSKHNKDDQFSSGQILCFHIEHLVDSRLSSLAWNWPSLLLTSTNRHRSPGYNFVQSNLRLRYPKYLSHLDFNSVTIPIDRFQFASNLQFLYIFSLESHDISWASAASILSCCYVCAGWYSTWLYFSSMALLTNVDISTYYGINTKEGGLLLLPTHIHLGSISIFQSFCHR